jgi:hypothetical protein
MVARLLSGLASEARDLLRIKRVRWFTWALAGILGVAAIGYTALKLTPDWFADDRLPLLPCPPASDEDFTACLDAAQARADDRRAVTTATLAILAGTVAVIGAIFTGLSYKLNSSGQITDRFTRAIDQLGNPALEVRIGGIYALERIARDSEPDQQPVVEALTAYVREHAPWPPTPATAAYPPSPQTADVSVEAVRSLERIATGAQIPTTSSSLPAPTTAGPEGLPAQSPGDVQAAIAVLGRRKTERESGWVRPNLTRTDLRGIRLVGYKVAQFGATNFAGACLDGAQFYMADFSEANLAGSSLKGARSATMIFASANLVGADLSDADLGSVDFSYADLSGANLQTTKFLLPEFEGLVHNADTLWPAGYDPQEYGAPPPRTDGEESMASAFWS